MSPDLASQFPEIRAYKGTSITNSTTTVQIELTPRGVTAQVLAIEGRWMLDPLVQGRPDVTISYLAKHTHTDGRHWKCDLHSGQHPGFGPRARGQIVHRHDPGIHRSVGQSLRTYRLAVAATAEYSKYHGGTSSGALSAITTTIARVAGIYERELAISFTLIGNNADIVFLDSATDPFTDATAEFEPPADYAGTLLEEAQTEITARIGSTNFDIGHIFSTGSGGIAALGSVCQDDRKASGMTGTANPVADAFDVDFVAHEIGHQFGGNHTYNGTVCDTGNPSTAYEPGGGTTIQAYAGICGSDDLQANSDPIFSAASFDEMIAYVEDGAGGSCATSTDVINPVTALVNKAPVVEAGSDYTVPNNTPLVITGSGTDADEDSLTYLWEQRDLGPKAALGAPDNGLSPLFRVWTPQANPSRYLPKLSTVVAGNQTTSEIMPALARTMDFRLTARDARGGVSSDDMVVNVVATDPLYPAFSLIEPSAGGESLGSVATVRWNVAGTDSAPISASNTDLYLSTDGGTTFSSTPFASVPNTGYARVTFPAGIQTSNARIMMRGSGNLFYDVTNADFALNSDAAATPETPAPVSWSLVPTNGGAELYFGEGSGASGSAGLHEAACYGQSSESYDTTQSVESALDAESPSQSATITLTATGSVPLAGLLLDLAIEHPYRGDLSVSITSPAGTTAVIKDSSSSDGADDIAFVDYVVRGFAGETIAGDWTLTVLDTYPSLDDGVWQSWGLSGSAVSTQIASGSGSSSPIAVTGMNNDWGYSCNLTAYDNSVTPIRGSQSVSAGQVTPSLSPVTYVVTPTAGANGTVSPSVPIPVASGNTLSLSLSPSDGFGVSSENGTCGGSLVGTKFTTSEITAACTVNFEFSTGAYSTPTSFIERFYVNILGRPSDEAGLNAWLELINTQSASAVALGFLNSTEFKNKGLDDVAFVDILYRSFFDRAGDEAGTGYWLEQLAAGKLREMVIWGFLNAAEFKTLSDGFGVAAVSAADQSAYGIRAFTERFYALVLGRQPDQGGFDIWVSSLTAGVYSGGDIAKAFFLSPEYLNQDTSDSAFVETAYQAFFGRAADEGGKQGWLTALLEGQSREDVLNGFIGSAEFATLTASYGIKPLRVSASRTLNSGEARSDRSTPIPALPWLAFLILSGLIGFVAARQLGAVNSGK
jgi:subtilisin-like proprotein convertase family protein